MKIKKWIKNNTFMKFLIFFERKSIRTIKVIYFVLVVVLLIANRYLDSNIVEVFFTETYSKYLAGHNDIIITVSTVLIGIYFTVYTLLISSDKDSIYHNFNSRNKIALVQIVHQGFQSSILYLLSSLIYDIISEYMLMYTNIIMLGLIIWMLYSGFVFGIIMNILIRAEIRNGVNSLDDNH